MKHLHDIDRKSLGYIKLKKLEKKKIKNKKMNT